jgi:lysophospholipase L1-like esterase
VKVPIAELTDAQFRTAEVFCPDLFHPNRIGHTAWADAAHPFVGGALSRVVRI